MRLDTLLLDHGLAADLHEAQGLIMAGKVVVDDNRADKPGALFSVHVGVRLKSGTSSWVSRGAFKLLAALQEWPCKLEGCIALDVGASTGGFTQVLLKEGVEKVYAVDVGYGQLAWSLQSSTQVINLERTHIARLDPALTQPKASCCVIDVSFTSLLNVMPFIANHITAGSQVYALIKPQFEIGRHDLEKGGVVKDANIREEVRDDVIRRISELGFTLRGFIDSPIKGADGNVEYMSCWNIGEQTRLRCIEESKKRSLRSNGENR
ncbi:MAG: TlyA family RNA methyltransferase [Deltaproteobacteria bacterium]|nr:TlyA family RNA methyltransferase [Deltaproteobacteria bacterium]